MNPHLSKTLDFLEDILPASPETMAEACASHAWGCSFRTETAGSYTFCTLSFPWLSEDGQRIDAETLEGGHAVHLNIVFAYDDSMKLCADLSAYTFPCRELYNADVQDHFEQESDWLFWETEILRSLYDASYPIEKMRLIDHYGADDQASMEDNNSSAFNFRPRAHQTAISKHALGLAIDINPLYNPYVLTTESGYRIVEPASAGAYLDRSADFPYKIERDDLCCTLFREHGFYWGGGWASRTKDFQHFER